MDFYHFFNLFVEVIVNNVLLHETAGELLLAAQRATHRARPATNKWTF